MVEQLQQQLLNIKDKSPLLLLNDAANLFASNYSKEIISLNTIDFNNFVRSFNYDEDKLTVLNLNSSFITSTLLSFLKRIKTPIILLAEDTHLDDEIISNIKVIIKYSHNNKSKLTDASTALNIWKEAEDKSNIDKFYANESPELYYLKSKFSMNKYIDLLSKGE